MLYRKPIEKIEWADIEAFCRQRRPEDSYLDYKRDFPEHLERTIAAMANTLGGLILVGPDEDAETRPIVPIGGLPFDRGLGERVMNIILDNITPPVFPEIQPCANPTGDKAVIVVRVPQSHQTPHAIAANTRVYVRTGNRNKPEDLATVERVEWLREHRRKSEELREQLYAQGVDRAEFFISRGLIEAQAPLTIVQEQSWLTVSCCPAYPRTAFLNPPDLLGVRPRVEIPDYPAQGTFPPSTQRTRVVQDGVVLTGIFEGPRLCHTELNIFGLFLYRQSAIRTPLGFPQEAIKVPAIWADDIFRRLDQSLTCAAVYYSQLGYWGPVLFDVHLAGLTGKNFIPYPLDAFPMADILQSPDREARFREVVSAADIADDRDNLILRAAQKIVWTFGANVTAEILQRCFKDLRRPEHRPL